MTEREGGSGKAKDNVRDEFGEATERRKTDKDAVEREEQAGSASGSGGVKDNVKDDWDESQRR